MSPSYLPFHDRPGRELGEDVLANRRDVAPVGELQAVPEDPVPFLDVDRVVVRLPGLDEGQVRRLEARGLLVGGRPGGHGGAVARQLGPGTGRRRRVGASRGEGDGQGGRHRQQRARPTRAYRYGSRAVHAGMVTRPPARCGPLADPVNRLRLRPARGPRGRPRWPGGRSPGPRPPRARRPRGAAAPAARARRRRRRGGGAASSRGTSERAGETSRRRSGTSMRCHAAPESSSLRSPARTSGPRSAMRLEDPLGVRDALPRLEAEVHRHRGQLAASLRRRPGRRRSPRVRSGQRTGSRAWSRREHPHPVGREDRGAAAAPVPPAPPHPAGAGEAVRAPAAEQPARHLLQAQDVGVDRPDDPCRQAVVVEEVARVVRRDAHDAHREPAVSR